MEPRPEIALALSASRKAPDLRDYVKSQEGQGLEFRGFSPIRKDQLGQGLEFRAFFLRRKVQVGSFPRLSLT